MTQHARIPSIYSILDGKTVTIPATPYTDGNPDPRPETAPPRGVVSPTRQTTIAQRIEIIRREWAKARAEA